MNRENINISMKPFGLKKADVDKYIENLIMDCKKVLNELLKEIKLLERTKGRLLLELKEVKTEEIVYEEETVEDIKAPNILVDDAYKRVEETIALINEIANQRIEQMAEKATNKLAGYNEILENLQKEIEENREKIEQLLGDVISLLKTNMDDTYSTDKKIILDKNDVIKESDNVITFINEKNKEKKSLNMVAKDLETKVIKNLEAYHNSKDQFINYLEDVMKPKVNGVPNGAVMLVEINEFVIANFFIDCSTGDILTNKIIEKIMNINDNLYVERLAYDQLGIIYNGLEDTEYISNIARIILRRVQKSIFVEDKMIDLSANIGIALYPKNADNAEAIMNFAGIALYKAKEQGKGLYQFIDEELICEVKFSNDFKSDLAEAIENNELELYYQPQYSAENNELVGFEALMRWQNDKYNKIPILDIIRLAEKEDLINDIGSLVLKKACYFAKKVQNKSSKRIIVSVNFSPLQVVRDDFVRNAKAIIEETGVSPKYLGFEITESCFMENLKENCAKIEQIKDMGITISIDDFGTGYSTLSYLLKLPVSVVKIDKTFLDDMTSRNRTEMFIGSIINISHNLGLKVVAEGIETDEQFKMLKNMKCDYLQGYFLAKPAPEAEALMYI